MNNADFIIPVEIDGTVHQVGTWMCLREYLLLHDIRCYRGCFLHSPSLCCKYQTPTCCTGSGVLAAWQSCSPLCWWLQAAGAYFSGLTKWRKPGMLLRNHGHQSQYVAHFRHSAQWGWHYLSSTGFKRQLQSVVLSRKKEEVSKGLGLFQVIQDRLVKGESLFRMTWFRNKAASILAKKVLLHMF